jgi:homoserine kinase type II
MAVYTALSKQEIEELLSLYDIGDLVDFQEISSGIENTNYFVTTSLRGQVSKRWVLTLFENLKQHDLPYFCDLTRHLEQDGFDVPAPTVSRLGNSIFCLKDKVGVIVPCLLGASLNAPNPQACASVGAYLASMHLSLRSFSQSRAVQRDIAWMKDQLDKLEPKMGLSEFQMLQGYFMRYCAYQPHLLACPQGTIHGDLFRDNVLFDEGLVSGVFDFYHACDATFMFDLAVVANDWAIEANGEHDKERLASLCEGYQSERPWTDKEEIMWPFCLELAALRFWLSRLVSCHLPSYQQASLAGDTIKNPDEMKAILVGLAAWNDEVVISA